MTSKEEIINHKEVDIRFEDTKISHLEAESVDKKIKGTFKQTRNGSKLS